MANHGNSFWGIVGAFAVGAVTGVLLAPRAGDDTRRRLSGIPRAIKEAYSQAKVAGIDAYNQSQDAQDGGKPPSHQH